MRFFNVFFIIFLIGISIRSINLFNVCYYNIYVCYTKNGLYLWMQAGFLCIVYNSPELTNLPTHTVTHMGKNREDSFIANPPDCFFILYEVCLACRRLE